MEICIRRLIIHSTAETPARGLSLDRPRLVPRDAGSRRQGYQPQRRRPRCLDSRHLVRSLLLTAVALWSAFYCGVALASTASAADFSTMTFDEWTSLFSATSTNMQLPQLYRIGPRVRTKIFVAKSVSLSELFNREAILRGRLSEVVGVSADRVMIEYLETTVTQEIARGPWAVSLGISALQAPPTVANTTPIAESIEQERRRIVDCLLHGRIVGTTNVTIDSLQLFDAPMQLLNVRLDGESFYQLDTTPWVGVSIVLAAQTTASALVSSTNSISSLDAFMNLRLRFLLARFLRALQLGPSAILIRDPWTLTQATQPYNTPAVIVPVEVHIGDDDSVRPAVNGYLRNASLMAEFQDLMPHWKLLAVEVDEIADALNGKSTGSTPTQPRIALPSVQQFVVSLLVKQLSLSHVQTRQHAIRDGVRDKLLSPALNGYKVEIDFYSVELAPSDQVTEIAVGSDEEAALFYDNDGSNAVWMVAPIDRPYVLHLALTLAISDTVQPVALSALEDGISAAINSLGASLALELSFIDYADQFITATTYADVHYKGVKALSPETVPLENTTATSGKKSFVEVSMAFVAGEEAQILSRAVQVDAFTLYRIRCALLTVLELVFVDEKDITLLSLSPNPSTTPQLAFQVNVRISILDEMQRYGISRALESRRFTQVLDASLGKQLQLLRRAVSLHADGSEGQQTTFPGTNSLIPSDSSDVSTPAQLPKRTDYVFSDPRFDGNPSVLTNTPANCQGGGTEGTAFAHSCLVVRWNSSFPAQTVFLRQISVASTSVKLRSSNILLPTASNEDGATTTTSPVAPWVPPTSSTDEPTNEPTAWAFQLQSDIAGVVTLHLWFEFADAVSNTVFPGFRITTDINLRRLSSTTTLPVDLPFRQLPSTLLPPTFVTAPSLVVSRSSNTFASVSSSNNEQPSTGANITLTLTQQLLLGLIDPVVAARTWLLRPNCPACLYPLEICNQHSECNAISMCFRRLVDKRLSLFDELLHSSEKHFDLTGILDSCLSSLSFHDRVWSMYGRSKFANGLRCVTMSSCPIAASLNALRQLALRYTPRYQKVRLLPAHLPLSLSFVVDVDGGVGQSVDGNSREQQTEVISEITPAALNNIKETISALYGALSNSMEVAVLSTTDAASNATEITMEYYFWDADFVGLPFVSVKVVNPQTQGPVAPVVETNATHALWLETVT